MRKILFKSLRSYFKGHIEKHITNIKIHTDSSVGVAEHPDHIQTIEKELEIIAEYEDKLNVLEKYFGENEKEVLNG